MDGVRALVPGDLQLARERWAGVSTAKKANVYGWAVRRVEA